MSRFGGDHIMKVAAEIAYNNYTDNHPTVHSNRFPSWSELSIEEKKKWLKIVQRDALH